MTYLNADQCAELLNVKKRTFQSLYSTRPDFPKPMVLSRKNKLWKAYEVRAFIEKRQQRQSNKSARLSAVGL